jgi:NADH-quinone oxidoreductase subunit F
MLYDHNKIFLNIAAAQKESHLLNEQEIFEKFSCLSKAFSNGDWDNTKKIIEKGRSYIVEEIKKSELCGRGGAGFPTGQKWSFIPEKSQKPHYLVINGDESEPGTCKDRYILSYEPQKIIEGALLAAVAIGAHCGYIYIRGEYAQEARMMEKAIKEAYENGLIGPDACGSGYSFDLYVHVGAGAYICGEESALLESLEGKKGLPRLRPPFPAHSGLYGCPTIINNIETIASVSTILRRGSDWFCSMGTKKHKGTRLFCLSGHVNKPCVIEEELGVNLRHVIDEYAAGVRGGWNNLKAIIPGGISTPIIPHYLCEDLSLDPKSINEAGSFLGTGGIVIIDQSSDMGALLERLCFFYKDESCGQCSPCREGTGWLWRLAVKIRKKEATIDDITLLDSLCDHIAPYTICGFAQAATLPVKAFLKHFKNDLI